MLGHFISKLGERALPFLKLMKKKGPFKWTPEADRAFQDLKRYLTSPPVMVAPRPLEPLVLCLAATPYSASATLVAVREEHQAKGTLHRATTEAMQDQEGAARAVAAPTEDQAQQDDAVKTPANHEASGVPSPQETCQLPQGASPDSVPALVEHPVYYVSTVLRDAKA